MSEEELLNEKKDNGSDINFIESMFDEEVYSKKVNIKIKSEN